MHILYFHQHFSTPEGSTGTRSYEMARALITAGHQVTMVCGSYQDGHTGLTKPFRNGVRSGDVHGIQVIEFELNYSNYDNFIKRTWIFLKFALRSIDTALKVPADLIFATSTPLTAGIPGIVARWLLNRRFVFEVRDLWPDLPRAMGVITNPLVLGLMSLLEKISYYSAHACIGLSPGIVEGIQSKSDSSKPVTMIPNGSDIQLFGNPAVKSRRPQTVNKEDLLAVFTGAHGIANGLDAVLDAAGELLRRGRDDIRLAFIGNGKLKGELQARVKEENLGNCLFLDPVPKTDLVAYLKGADIGLMILANVPAFYYGTSPNKFFDYLAAGLPVINNYPGWLADMIIEKDLGRVVPPDDPQAFAETLIELAENREKLEQMGNNSRMTAGELFDRSCLSREFVHFLETV